MKKAIALLLVLMILLTGCSGQENLIVTEPELIVTEPELIVTAPEQTESTEELDCAGTDEMPWYNAEITDFGLGLLRYSLEDGGNALISPVSIYAALSMTANGAQGDTLAQMEAVLGQSTEDLNAWYQEHMSKDSNDLHLANALYIKDDPELTVSESFIKTIAQYYVGENYASDVMMTLFNEYTADGINQFVADNTDGMIKNIVTEVPEDALMYLVNALAFEARWAVPYNEYQVSEQVFTTEDGREQAVELMYKEDTNAYVEGDLCTGFLKDYEGGRYAFAALLPKEGVSVKELADSLSGDAVIELLNYRWEDKVLTGMPKFQTEFDVEMHEILQTMGMSDAFDPNKADFSGLATYNGNNIFINRVLHKTFISVGEQGTRAGAATAVELIAGAAMLPEEPKEVILNRPFLYLIWDTEANMPLFIGTFMDAQAEGTSVPAETDEIFYSPAEGPCVIVDE